MTLSDAPLDLSGTRDGPCSTPSSWIPLLVVCTVVSGTFSKVRTCITVGGLSSGCQGWECLRIFIPGGTVLDQWWMMGNAA